jgi:hypothetical protein
VKRRTLDIIFAGGGVVVAVLLFVLGFVLMDQQNFAKDYVKGELGAQQIWFSATPTDEEKTWKPGSTCLTEYAGKLMQTGPQAECYAKYYIAKHMDTSAKNLKFSSPINVKLGSGDATLTTMEGQTYATIGTIRTALAADQKALADKGDKAAADARQKDVDAAASLRTTMQTGETLKGLLLTSYGFSIFGEKAGVAADVAFAAAVVVFIVAIAGFVHAFMEARRVRTASAGAQSKAGAATLEPR